MDLSEVAIKATLMQMSRVYRGKMDLDIDYNLTDKEALEAKETMIRLMRHSEDEHLQFKIAKYVLDDKKGRLDIGKNLGGMKMDVTIFNQFLIDAKDAINQSKRGDARIGAPPEKQLIDV